MYVSICVFKSMYISFNWFIYVYTQNACNLVAFKKIIVFGFMLFKLVWICRKKKVVFVMKLKDTEEDQSQW